MGAVGEVKGVDVNRGATSEAQDFTLKTAVTYRKFALSCSGGGIRGIGQAVVLEKVEELLGTLSEALHLVGGVSTGSINAYGVAHGFKASQLKSFYWNYAPKIFPQGLKETLDDPLELIIGPKYRVKPLQEALQAILGEAKVSQQKMETQIATTISYPRLETLYIRRSEACKNPHIDAVPAWQWVANSCAAPWYLPPEEISLGNEKLTCLDGGLGYNNPAQVTEQYAQELWGGSNMELSLLSIGAGYAPLLFPADQIRTKGGLFWGITVFGLSSQLVANNVHQDLRRRYPDPARYLYLQPELEPQNASLDKATRANMQEVVETFEHYLDDHLNDLEAFCRNHEKYRTDAYGFKQPISVVS